MKFKKEIIAIILIISMLFTISAISAADSSTDAVSVTNADVEAVSEDVADNNLTMKNDVEILGETDGGTYADLSAKISGASVNSVIYLENDYVYTDESPDSITISIYNLTIDGRGHYIDAKEKCRIFASTNKLTLKNIKFLNAKSSTGAVYCQSTDLVIDNCTFINNVANNYGGGAVCVWSNSNANIINSKFKGNLNSGTRLNGGAISVNGYVLINNCTFEENSGTYYGGGAIGIYTSGSADISNSTFLSNHATDDGGGAIENYGSVNIDKCIFMDNTAVYAGSAIYLYGSGNVINSIFINNPDTIISASSSSTASHNWFGTTTKNYQTSIPDVSEISMDDYYVLDLNLVNNDESATVSLNNLLENDVVTPNCEYTLPIIDLTVDAMGITVPNSVRLQSNGMANIAHEPADAYSMTIGYGGVNLITEEIKPSFSLLSNKISSDGVNEIILQQDYIYDSSKDSSLTNGIEFAKDMTIDGQGHLIDAKQSSNIFYFNDETNSYSLTLKNIIFANATGTNGAAVYFKGKKIEIINCTFINNNADSEGDAIYIADATSTDNRITESEFRDNAGSNSVAYINLDSTDAKLKLTNSIFMKNSAAKNIKGTSNVVAEYNWWGNTIENKADILKTDGITVNNWLFLKIDANAVKQGTATISLNNVYDGSSVSTYSNYALHPLTFTLGGTNTASSLHEITLGDNGQANYQFRMYRTNAALTASYDDITTTKELECTIVDDGSFKALSDLVWFSGDVLELTHDYVYSDSDTITDGIVMPKKITINGNGHTIDAKGKTRIFAPERGVSQVTLNNISFVNAKSGQGSVIIIQYTSDDWNILNCNFTNNTATMFGGVIDCIGDYCTIDNCNFINNTARYASVIRYNHDTMAYIKNSYFINNAATDGDNYGGVIYAQDGKVTIDKSIFMNNQVQGTLGSVLNTKKGATITNSIFLNNTGSGNIIYGTYSLSVQSSWFGNTFENLNNEPSNYYIFNPKWLYLDFKFMEENVIISLNNLYDKSTATSSVYSEYNLPEITLNLNSTNLNLNTDKVTLDSTGKAIVPYTKIADDAALTVSCNDVSLTKDFAIGDFDLLQDLIDTAAGDTIELNRNYTFIDGVDTLTDGISITRDITIDGKGHTINGSNLARILYITTNGVTLKNINFVDGYATHGGAIYNNGGSGFKLINCTFENNVAYNNPGGAIYTYSNGENDFINCTFIANKMTKANQYGGAVYIYENSGQNNFIGCAFINNSAYYAGAIATGNGKAITNVDKSIFITNTANNYPSIYIRGGSSAEFYLKNSIIFNKGFTTDTATQVYAYSTLRASDVNYNWWMHTADNKAQSAYVRCSGGGLTVNKYLFLDMDCESDIATISINNVYDKSSGTTSKYDGELPQITFDISGTNVVVDDTATLNRNGVAEAAYDMTAQTGSLTATYNSVSITKQLTVDDSFTALQGKISRAMEGSELLLYHDYNYDSTKDSSLTEGIVIDRDLTIDGQGYTIDAKNTAKIFKINDNTKNIVLKNINFVNAAGADGAAVYANCNNIEIINCTFENNEATGNGSALYVVANSCNITESTFVNNVGSVSTIYLDCESDEATFNIDNSILVNNGGSDVAKVKGTLTADYNWWGNTADNTNDLSGGLAQKWYILDMTVDDAKSIATLSLNNLNDGTTYENYALPSITLNMQATNGFVRKDEVTLDENGYANVGYLATDAGASITAEYNGVSITREITYDTDSDYSFKALKKLIDQASDNDVITLTHDYDYVIGYDDEYTFSDDAITAGIDIVKKNLTINGNGFIIDAKGKTRIFNVKDSGSNLTIRNVTFSNGKMSANGGAILWYGDDGNLENCTFINNDAGSYSGGAIYTQGDNLNISNSRFIDNKASKAAGIYVLSENVTIKNSTFINNGGGSYGGAISVKANNLNIINSTFTGNTVTYQGGALYLESGNDVNIVDSRFINNFASTSGGAIYWVTGKNRNITNSTFTNNKATTSGGAIYFANTISGAETTVYGSTFFNNTAISGGAIYVYSGSLDINKTEFIDNIVQSTSKATYGGAIYDTSSEKITIANSNFTGNLAKTSSQSVYAGVIYTTNGEIDIANSTFNKNSIDTVSGLYTYGSVIYWKDANGKITNSSFLNNHGKSSSGSAIYITGASSNANVTNSIFINNTYGTTNSLKVLTRGGGNIEFNDCWFGNTKETSGESMGTTTGTGISYKNKLDLYTVHDEYMAVGEDKEIKFVLQYVESGKVIIYDSSKLPKVDLTLSAVNGEIDRNSASMDDAVLFNANQFGPASITAKFNGIELTENLYAKDKPTITVEEPIVVHVDESVSVNIQKLIPQEASLTFSSIDGDEFIFVASNGYVEGLKEGNSTLYIHYGGNENYVPATVEVPVTVIKYTTSMSCDVDSISVDWGADSQSVTIDFDSGNPDLNPLNPGQYDQFVLKFKSNDTNVATVSIVEGKPQINFHSAGTANVTFYFEGNEKYYASEKNITVTVNKVPSSLTISDDVELDYGSSGTTTLTLDGATVDDANIIVENHPEAVIGYENNVVTVSGLDVGTYTLKVTTTPDENHTSVEGTASITVNKVDSSVEFSGDVEFDYLSSGTVTLTLVGCTVSVENITVEGQQANVQYNPDTHVVTVSGLDAGTYTLKVTTTPDSNHNSIVATADIIVNKIDSSVGFSNDVVFDYLSSGTTTLIDFVGCTVDLANITVVEHPEAVIGFENNVITVSALGAGTHTLNVKTTPDSNHKSVDATAAITVNKIASSITLSNTDIIYNYEESNTTTLTLVGCSVDLANITVDGINVEGVSYDSQTKIITISGLDVGAHTLKVVTTPDENHTSVEGTASITVEKSNSSVSFSNPVSFFVSEEGETTLTLVGCTVDSISVVDHSEAVIDYDPQTKVITVSGLDMGTYTLKVVTAPDSNHLAVENTTTVSVGKESPKLVMEYSNVTVGEKEYVYVSMIAAGEVKITISDGDSVIRNENVTIADNGFNKIIFTDLKVGTYTISAYYKGHGKYNDSTLNYKLVIRPIYEYGASAVANDTVMGNTTNVTVTLPEDATGYILIGDKNTTVKPVKTVIELPAQDKLGKNNITVKYVPDSDSKYAAREFTVVYDVAKVDTEITLTFVNSTTDNPVTITAAINAEGSVIFDVNGTKYSREINSDGKAVLELNNVAGGKYNVTATYAGNGFYANSSANGSFAVEKIDLAILDPQPDKNPINTDETTKVSVNVGDGTGIVTFTVNGIETNVTVDDNGDAALTLSNLPKGETRIKAKYLGDGKYNSKESEEIPLTVNPVQVNLDMDIANITVGEDAIVYVFLPKDAAGNVNITVTNDNEYYFSENIALKSAISDLGVGNYTVTAKYYGDDKYDEKVITKKFTVNPLNAGKLNFTVSVNDTVIGGDTDVNVTLPEDAEGELEINGIHYNIGDKITITPTKAGMNNITVKYIPKEGSKYSKDEVTAFYYVAKKTAEINITENNKDKIAGNNVDIPISAYDGADIVVLIDGSKTELKDGKVTIENITAGTHTIVASVDETDNYTAASANYTFEVTKQDVGAFTVVCYEATQSETVTVGEKATIQVNLIDKNDITGIVIVNVNGIKYSLDYSKDNNTIAAVMNAAGLVNLSAEYLGNYKYNAKVSQSNSFTVIDKQTPQITVSGIENAVVDKELTFTVGPNVEGTIVKINDETITPSNGNYKYTPKTSGSFILTVEIPEDATYHKTFYTQEFIVSKKDVDISISSVNSVKVGKKATITVNIDKDATGIVVVNVDGVDYSLNISKTRSLDVLMNKVGDIPVSAKYAGDEKFNAADAKAIAVKVTEKSTPSITIEVNPEYAIVGDTVNIKVTTNGYNLKVFLNDEQINANYAFKPTKDGAYTIVAKTSENDDYYAVEKATSFTVINKTKQTPQITVNGIGDVEVGEELTFTVDSDVAGAVVKINGEVINPTRGPYKYVPQVGGVHILSVETPENGIYSKGLYTTNFNVDKKQSPIQISIQGELTVDKNIRLIISSYDGAEIAVMVDGKEFNWQNTFKATAGEHLVVASVAENDQYLSNTTSYTFTVAKAKSSISVSGNQVILGQASTITVGLTNGATGMVIVNVGGTEYSINASKSKSLSVVLSKPGTYDISARYLGDEKYLPSESASNTLIVEDKEKTTIDVYTPKDVNAGDNVEIEVVSNNNAIEVYFDGVKQTLKDDKFTVRNIKAGSHEIRVEGPETSELKSNATVSVFNADKQASEVTITLPKTISIGKDIVIEFSSYDGADITAVIDGVKQTLTGGKATLKATAGAHTIVASVDETDKYLASGANKTFNVDKLNSQIAVSGVDIAEGETSKITITTNVNEGIVIVNVADKQVAVDLAKAKSVDIELDTAGTYDLTANYLGTDIYKPSVAAKSTIKVQSKPAAKVDITIPDIKAGESKPISISIPNATGDVHVIVDGVDNVVTLDKDGKASYPLDNIASGEHNVVVVYDDGVNDPAISSKSFNVSKQTAKAEITTPANVKEGENATVKVNIPGATGEVSVIVDGNEEKIALVNGAAEYQLNNVSGGEHSVVVIYPGDETHDSAYSASSFDVAKKPAVVKKASEFSDITIDDDLMISFILKDEDGNPIRDAVIKYNDGTEKTVKTDYHGQFRIQAVNNALISITYEGNAAITGTGTAFKLNVPAAPVSQKVETHFDIPDRSVTLTGYAVDFIAGEEGIYYSTTLLDANGKPVSNAYMEFAVNNKIYNRTTDAKGSFTPYKLNMIRAGRYTMAFNFAGNENYTNTFACVCVDLDKKPITIKAASKTFKASVKTKKYTVSLSTIVGSSHDGKIYLKSGKPVTLTVNGKKYTAQTNSKNKATFKITGLSKKGTYDATIYFKGDKTYAEKEKTVKLTIS